VGVKLITNLHLVPQLRLPETAVSLPTVAYGVVNNSLFLLKSRGPDRKCYVPDRFYLDSFYFVVENADCLCGLIVRVSGYSPEVRFRFLALRDFLSSSGSGNGFTHSREHNWGATLKKKWLSRKKKRATESIIIILIIIITIRMSDGLCVDTIPLGMHMYIPVSPSPIWESHFIFRFT
jgi:hypothetical protein